ncbi:MAG: hypothetical protein AAFV88_04045 [Planctomycetota bacterium]
MRKPLQPVAIRHAKQVLTLNAKGSLAINDPFLSTCFGGDRLDELFSGVIMIDLQIAGPDATLRGDSRVGGKKIRQRRELMICRSQVCRGIGALNISMAVMQVTVACCDVLAMGNEVTCR